ncbi:MAG: sensor domain-containing protein [Anaerolineaceae bacterium]|nr:sensor domain-containing protein [Anaerolineaceae bacterium]
MDSNKYSLEKFFGVAIQGQTYLNALYLLLAFPLGLFYFIFLVTGLSLGVSLIIVWVGLFLLVLVFAVWYALLVLERQMAISLLHEEIPPITHESYSGKTAWQKLKAALSNPVTWKGLLYLFAKFPLGIISFVVLVTFLSVSFALLAAPLYYQWVQPQVSMDLGSGLWSPWIIDTLPKALGACAAGVFMLFISMHIFNGLAWVSGKFARIMLGNFSSQPGVPSTPAVSTSVETFTSSNTPASTMPPVSPISSTSPEALASTEMPESSDTPASIDTVDSSLPNPPSDSPAAEG